MSGVVVLVDISGSMDTPVSADQRRIDALRTILGTVLPSLPDARVVAFSDTVAVLEPGKPVPEPGGGTALHLALERVQSMNPDHLVVISDGEPADKQAAVTAARALDGCTINAYPCGSEDDRAGAAFLKTLCLCSRRGIGRAMLGDLRKKSPEQVAGELRLLLAGPAR
jgi:Mg-chelatase subunit ChlD